MAVPAHHLSALGIARCPPGPAFVHRVAYVVVDPDGDGGVTGDLAHGIGADQAISLELASEQWSSRPTPRPRWPRGTWTTTKYGLATEGTPGSRRADHLDEGVAEALVPGRLAVGGHVAGPGLEADLGLGEGLGRELHGHGAELIVEAQEAPVVLGSPRRRLGGNIRAGQFGQLAHRALAGPGHKVPGHSRGWPPPLRRGACPGTGPRRTSTRRDAACPRPCRRDGSGPAPSGSKPRSAPRPRVRSLSPPHLGRPGAGRPHPKGRRWLLRRPPSDGRARRDARRSLRSTRPRPKRSRPLESRASQRERSLPSRSEAQGSTSWHPRSRRLGVGVVSLRRRATAPTTRRSPPTPGRARGRSRPPSPGRPRSGCRAGR